MSTPSGEAKGLKPLWDPAPSVISVDPASPWSVGYSIPVRHTVGMKKFVPPSWAEPEPGEETVEIFYTDDIPTAEIQLPGRWRMARKLKSLIRPPGRHRKA